MDEFKVIAKIWPSGAPLDLGVDTTTLNLTPPNTFSASKAAAPFVTSPDGTQNYQFLFWNTGRHMTNKRRVKWNFSLFGWGAWTAIKWYGTPPIPNGGGPARVRVDGFSIGDDALLTGGTPIDGAASTFAANAWPFNNDDHVIGTAAGPASVAAKNPFNSYDFAGWMQLLWGGDPTDEFSESDTGTTGSGSQNSTSFYDHVTGVSFPVAMGASADLLATYGYYNRPEIPDWFTEILPGDWNLRELVEILYPSRGEPGGPFTDTNPIDRLRVKVLEELVQQARPNLARGTDFQRLLETAPEMSRDELKRAIQSVKTTLELGNTALNRMESQMKKLPK